MLGMKTYPKPYIAACRARVDADLSAYRKHSGKTASRDFEARFFNNEVLLLDYMFVHRLTGVEGKDGNPLNEVRVLCNSLLLNGGKLQVEKLGSAVSDRPGRRVRDGRARDVQGQAAEGDRQGGHGRGHD